LKRLTFKEFEEVLMPVFREDTPTLIAVGVLLGGVAGLWQSIVMTFLSDGPQSVCLSWAEVLLLE
jgi:hypothetical protein